MSVEFDVEDCLAKFFTQNKSLLDENQYAVAVSGGPDSMALLQALTKYCDTHQKELHAITVDHGFREVAKTEALNVKKWVEDQSAQYLTHVTLEWEGEKPDSKILEVAREKRYALMANYCAKHDIKTLFVAHHQDDQMETFLIRLCKGSGLDGLASMANMHEYNPSLNIARPFLSLSKEALINYCTQHKIDVAQDPTNEDENYLRPRLRQSKEVFEQEGLNAKRITTLASRLSRARKALEGIANDAFKATQIQSQEDQIVFDFEKLNQHPEEIILRILKLSLENIVPKTNYGVRMDRLENLMHDMLHDTENFKPRTLGGCIFALKDKNKALYIRKES